MAKGMSAVQRTIRELKDEGRICAIVERWNPHVGRFGIRQDLFGIIDILALDPERGVVGIQVCSHSMSAHRKKIFDKHYEDTLEWLRTPGTCFELWCWRKRKVKRGGKAMRWHAKIEEITLEDLE